MEEGLDQPVGPAMRPLVDVDQELAPVMGQRQDVAQVGAAVDQDEVVVGYLPMNCHAGMLRYGFETCRLSVKAT
jgi:hypothetical protein